MRSSRVFQPRPVGVYQTNPFIGKTHPSHPMPNSSTRHRGGVKMRTVNEELLHQISTVAQSVSLDDGRPNPKGHRNNRGDDDGGGSIPEIVQSSYFEHETFNAGKPATALNRSAAGIPTSLAVNASAKQGYNAAHSKRKQYGDSIDKFTALLESFRKKNFAEKLFALLEIQDFQDIMCWHPSGDAFYIYDQSAFVSQVMAVHFQRAKFESFTRRMRRWGFRRIESMEQKMRGIAVFSCKLFRRDKPDLCKLMCDDRQLKKKSGADAISQAGGADLNQYDVGFYLQQLDQTSGSSTRSPDISPPIVACLQPSAPIEINGVGRNNYLARSDIVSLEARQAEVKAFARSHKLGMRATSSIYGTPPSPSPPRFILTSIFPAQAPQHLLLPPAPYRAIMEHNAHVGTLYKSNQRLIDLDADIQDCEAELALVTRLKELKRKRMSLEMMNSMPRFDRPEQDG